MSILTMSTLGGNGRLGNQMFQYAALLGLASTWNMKVALCRKSRLGDVFSLTENRTGNAGFVLVREHPNDCCVYRETILNQELSRHSVDLFGYFQTDKYWKHISSTICSTFRFKDQSIDSQAKLLVDSVRANGLPIVALCVRRTDYLATSVHALDPVWYDIAMNTMRQRIGLANYIMISDDPDWCSEYFPRRFNGFGNFVSARNTDLIELSIIKQTDHIIIANSTFHWWGAWLNQNPSKLVVVPGKWFGRGGPTRWEDIYCDGWIVPDRNQ